MKNNTVFKICALQVCLLAGCSRSGSLANKTDTVFPVEMDSVTNAKDMQTISNILSSPNWPIIKKAESGQFGKITIRLAMGTNFAANHYNLSWNGSGWQVSPTNQ
jgi:hypothetical protein